METLIEAPVKKSWKSRTVNGIFQINFDTEYRGYRIHPVFNYDDGHSDFEVFRSDEEGMMFHRCTLSYVKRIICEMIEESQNNPQS